MFGPFRQSATAFGGLLWKSPWRMSKTRKMRARLRLKAVDDVIATVEASGVQTHSLVRALALPTEQEMHPKDKYTTFSRTDPGYRKSMHKVPKWTRITSRTNPLGF
ncbi:putative MRPL31-mitochondrial ribosomal protein, large subunit [Leucosporidium creatinivorum]|uniref:Large ribosomal subunit protein mL60 n=1 Tax=Leucosporidium creatinivorum TaxID=106004 RepID=A0A1Y2C373_9BASI|nr:putative MRPL31-mitochondrial ribosomal protein, large subunit [Leucosporidium creatinivorum]